MAHHDRHHRRGRNSARRFLIVGAFFVAFQSNTSTRDEDHAVTELTPATQPTRRPGRKTDRVNGPRVAPIAEPVVIREWKRDRSGNVIRLTLKSYEGTNIIDLRTWFSANGHRLPGKGFACHVRQLPALAEAMTAACASARDLGLIDDERS
jgi:hypothetical protein